MKKLLSVLSVLLILSACTNSKTKSITLHAGAGLRNAVAPLVKLFEKENPNIKINVNYGGGGKLLGQIITGKLDGLFMPGDSFYVEEAIKKGVAISSSKRTVAYFVPVIFVQKNNPKKIFSLNDFIREDLNIGLGDARSAAIGKCSLKLFEKNNIPFDKVKKQVTVQTSTVNELGIAIAAKTVDAVIIWDATARHFATYGDMISIPQKNNVISVIPIVLLKSTDEKDAAKKFINFCISKRGIEIFKKNGYTIN